MNKKTFIILLISLLVLSNFIMAWFLIKPKPHRFGPDQPKNIIIKKLRFNDNQVEKYELLIDEHRKEIRKRDEKIMNLKNKLYLGLNNNTDSSSVNVLMDSITSIQKEIELIHYRHFQDIKSLCEGDQLNDFSKLSQELSKIFSPQKPPR